MDFSDGRRERSFYQQEGERHQPSSSSSSSVVRWAGEASIGPLSSSDRAAEQGAGPPPIEKEHMFDKVVTPSDVGKLNRLVIPKQHAEKYFPLDSSTNDKGFLLTFEDRTGKPWRFRYSYWNSSQSYVMTKGWSRFVKEKRLDAGDTVSFGRGVGESGRGRLFIDWKRRIDARPPEHPHPPPPGLFHTRHHPMVMVPFAPWGCNRHFFPTPSHPYNVAESHIGSSAGSQYLYLRASAGAFPPAPPILDSVPVVHSKSAAAAKRVRLFGVNLDCPEPDYVVDPEGNSTRGLHEPPPPSILPLHLRLGAAVLPSGKEQQP